LKPLIDYGFICLNKYMEQENKGRKYLTALFTTVLLITIGLLLAANNIVLAEGNEDNVQYNIKDMVFRTDTQLERSSRRPKLVHIKKGDYVYSIFTVETDIYKILDEFQITLSGQERVIISTQYITNGSLVRVIKTETIIGEVEEEIPFATKTIKTDKYLKGEEYISQEGVLGIKKQKVISYYEDGVLIESRILAERTVREPVTKVLEIGTSMYSLAGIDPKGYNCEYWYQVVDTGPYTEEEKRWLKFIMYCESGCNAESNKSSYKGLFQWSPYWWSKQFKENIFDGHAQIRHTIVKYRAGESTRLSQWPACHAKYNRTYVVN